MKFQPKTEKEITEDNLLQPGVYDFEIVEGNDKTSQKGNDMIELKVCVYGTDGNARYVFDYLLESIAYKLRHACDACGLLETYQTGDLTSQDFVGKTGKCKINIQKDKTGQYADKNSIQDYVKRENMNSDMPHGKQPPAGLIGEGKPLDDEIPF